MAFTRKWLSALGIDADKIDEIISAHIEVVDGLKQERDDLSEKVNSLTETNKTLEDEKKQLEQGHGDDYEKLKKEFDAYKADVLGKETKAEKATAYRELLRANGISEKRLDAILKVTDIDAIELDKDKKIKDEKSLSEKIKAEWADFIETQSVQGVKTATPPVNTGSGNGMTKEQILSIKDAEARQKAIANNLNLFMKGIN